MEVFWQDDRLERTRLTHTSESVLQALPRWEVDIMEKAAAAGDAFLFFDCTCAGVFDNTPASLVARALALENEHLQRVWRFFVRNSVNWSTATVPTESWARKVYPTLSTAEGIRALWNDIFVAARVTADNYAERWRLHRAMLETRSTTLNGLKLRKLHFTAPGTDLSVGVPFIADIPIEEVFTLPDRHAVNGTVQTTRALVVSGRTVSSFRGPERVVKPNWPTSSA